MAVRGLQRDVNGHILLPGKVLKDQVWGFEQAAALPAGFAASGSGSVSFPSASPSGAAQGSGLGYVQVTTPSGGTETVAGPTINLADPTLAALWWEVQGIQDQDTNANTVGLNLNSGSGIASGSKGGVYLTNNTLKTTSSTGTSTTAFSAQLDNNPPNSRNLGLLMVLQPVAGTVSPHVYIMLDEAVIADVDLTGNAGSYGSLTLGLINPGFFFSAASSTVANVIVKQMRLRSANY